jgi:hypothetical protein
VVETISSIAEALGVSVPIPTLLLCALLFLIKEKIIDNIANA